MQRGHTPCDEPGRHGKTHGNGPLRTVFCVPAGCCVASYVSGHEHRRSRRVTALWPTAGVRQEAYPLRATGTGPPNSDGPSHYEQEREPPPHICAALCMAHGRWLSKASFIQLRPAAAREVVVMAAAATAAAAMELGLSHHWEALKKPKKTLACDHTRVSRAVTGKRQDWVTNVV